METIPNTEEDLLMIRMMRTEQDWNFESLMSLYICTLYLPPDSHERLHSLNLTS